MHARSKPIRLPPGIVAPAVSTCTFRVPSGEQRWRYRPPKSSTSLPRRYPSFATRLLRYRATWADRRLMMMPNGFVIIF
jgi:hypothetical protein